MNTAEKTQNKPKNMASAKPRANLSVMRIPTDQGEFAVAMVDLFAITLDGEQFWFAVHVSPVVGLSLNRSSFRLSVSEYSTGYRLTMLSHGNPRQYSRAQADTLIAGARHQLGDAKLVAGLRKFIAEKPRLNTLPNTQAQAGQGGAA